MRSHRPSSQIPLFDGSMFVFHFAYPHTVACKGHKRIFWPFIGEPFGIGSAVHRRGSVPKKIVCSDKARGGSPTDWLADPLIRLVPGRSL